MYGFIVVTLATFYAECCRFRKDNRALFICFPRSLESVVARWYADHINPIELREFDKVVNLFIERFLFNTEASPTLNHLYNLKQGETERAGDFIHRWRSTCNKMKVPIPEEHALQIILNNFSQPIRSLIATSPAKSFIKLIERVEWLEAGIESGLYKGTPLVKNIQDQKKKAQFAHSVDASCNSLGSSSKGNKNNNGSGPRLDQNKGQKERSYKNNDKPLPIGLQQKGDLQEKPKYIKWEKDRVFTPLDQTLETVLDYLLKHGMIKLPKIADPPIILGKIQRPVLQVS